MKLDGRTGEVEKTRTGFTTVTGVAVDGEGSLYVSQLFAPEANAANPMIQGVLTKVTRRREAPRHQRALPGGCAW